MTLLETMPVEPERDRWGRPLVVPPEGGKPVPYTRCTTYVGSIEDTYNLSRWQQRMVAVGLSSRPDLQLSVAAHRENRKELDRICEDAMNAAQAHAGATTGTALHALTERMDRGLDVGVVPDEYLADLAAYQRATEAMTAVLIEQFCVQDALRVGGTPDRVVTYNGTRYIADLKTGKIDYGYLKIAAQLAMYARSRPYDVTTNARLDNHDADLDRGIVIHLPAGTGECRLYWVDLNVGWEAVKTCRSVRAKRSIPFRDLFDPLDDGPKPLTTPAPQPPSEQAPLFIATLLDQIAAATTEQAVRDLWRDNAAEWTDEHTAAAKARIAALG